jgi:SpoVK/Ycf46/Vps4 family AAA+-type ATPase
MYARKTKKFANARAVRNLFDATKENLSSRIIAMKKSGASEDDMKREAAFLHPQDIPGHTESEKELSLDDVLKELNEMIGLKSVKDSVTKIADTLKVQKISGKTKIIEKHFVFTGSPGTGKTTVARIMANVFKALGILPTNKMVEVNKSKLIGQVLGETPKLVNKQVDSALGGVLFIDEAYNLVSRKDDMYGNEAVAELLTRLENDRGKFICIVAGYTKEIKTFLESNSGFGSRFTDYINFEDYSPAEMREIFISMCKKDENEFGDGFDDALQKRLTDLYEKKSTQFANARTVRNIYNATIANLSSRIVKMQKAGTSEDEVKREVSIMRPEDLDMTVT